MTLAIFPPATDWTNCKPIEGFNEFPVETAMRENIKTSLRSNPTKGDDKDRFLLPFFQTRLLRVFQRADLARGICASKSKPRRTGVV
jgi:hypothetical protein